MSAGATALWSWVVLAGEPPNEAISSVDIRLDGVRDLPGFDELGAISVELYS